MNVNWHTTRENMVYGEENSLQFRTHGITRASHQISQSTYSLLFFKGRAGYESKSLVEWTRKNKTDLQKVLVFVHVGLLMEHETAEAWGDLQELLQLQHRRDRGMLMCPWTTMMWMLTPGILQHFTCNDSGKMEKWQLITILILWDLKCESLAPVINLSESLKETTTS